MQDIGAKACKKKMHQDRAQELCVLQKGADEGKRESTPSQQEIQHGDGVARLASQAPTLRHVRGLSRAQKGGNPESPMYRSGCDINFLRQHGMHSMAAGS